MQYAIYLENYYKQRVIDAKVCMCKLYFDVRGDDSATIDM